MRSLLEQAPAVLYVAHDERVNGRERRMADEAAAGTPMATGSPGAQVQKTEGLADTMSRPGLVNRALMRFVAWAEGLNLRCAKLGNPPVYDNAAFPWAAGIEREWHLIRAELDQVLRRKDELPGF